MVGGRNQLHKGRTSAGAHLHSGHVAFRVSQSPMHSPQKQWPQGTKLCAATVASLQMGHSWEPLYASGAAGAAGGSRPTGSSASMRTGDVGRERLTGFTCRHSKQTGVSFRPKE